MVEKEKKPTKRRATKLALDPMATMHLKELQKLYPKGDETVLIQTAEAYSTYRQTQENLQEYVNTMGSTIGPNNQPCGEFKNYLAMLDAYNKQRKLLGNQENRTGSADIEGLPDVPNVID